MKPKGMVYLVGAGPGDAGLFTLRGVELLRRADVVVYDSLVNPDLLRFAPASAEIINATIPSSAGPVPSDELKALLVAKARAGKIVVRLSCGDPYLFGQGSEEAEQMADAGIAFEAVPGVTSFAATTNYAGVPLTHREFCAEVTFIGNIDASSKGPQSIDWKQLAKTPGTKVIMLNTGCLRQISEELVSHGLPHSTPVAIGRYGTTDHRHSLEGTLATIADLAAKADIGSPAIAVIGDVVRLRKKLNWFERRPLFGQRIVVTRRREQAEELSCQLREQGANVLEIPVIRMGPPTRKDDFVDALLALNAYDWLVFTSPNGVRAFFEHFFKRFHDMRDLGGARIAAVGPATAKKLKDLHLQVDLMPEEALASKIAAAFAKFESVENLKICLLRAEVANRELPDALEALGAIVDDVACYKTEPETADPGGVAANLLESGADWIAFTSGSTVDHFHARFNLPDLLRKFPRVKLASIGPETSKALAVLKLKPSVEAKQHTIDGLVEALVGISK